jgi:hypothetical protein
MIDSKNSEVNEYLILVKQPTDAGLTVQMFVLKPASQLINETVKMLTYHINKISLHASKSNIYHNMIVCNVNHITLIASISHLHILVITHIAVSIVIAVCDGGSMFAIVSCPLALVPFPFPLHDHPVNGGRFSLQAL